MTYDETAEIVKKLHDFYSREDRFATGQELISRTNYWDVIFKDFTYKVVDKVVNVWTKSHRDMPMPSDLLPMCKDERDLEWSVGKSINLENMKPTHIQIWEARNGPIENMVVTHEASAMTDKLIEWIKADPKRRKEIIEEDKAEKIAAAVPNPGIEQTIIKSEVLGNVLPYEI